MSASPESYDQWHEKYDVDRDTNTPWHLMVKDQLSHTDLARRKILEAGCGRGGFACWLASTHSKFERFTAMDISQTALDKAKSFSTSQNISGIQWVKGSVMSLPFEDASLDVVISCETIEHVLKPRVALAEFSRVLASGGSLILTVPNYLGPYGLYRGYLRLTGRKFTEEGQPINNFLTLPQTLGWIRREGFKVERVTGRGHYLLVPGRQPIEMKFLNHLNGLTRWFALHTMIVAKKI